MTLVAIATSPESGVVRDVMIIEKSPDMWSMYDKFLARQSPEESCVLWDSFTRVSVLNSRTLGTWWNFGNVADFVRNQVLEDTRRTIGKIGMIKMTRQRFDGLHLRDAKHIVDSFFVF